MDGQPTWTDCDEAGDYVVPNVLSPRDLVSRPDKMDETVLHSIRDWNDLPESPISSSELSDEGVPKFTSLVRARA